MAMKKILIIDDEPEILELISRCVEAGGYQVISADTGAKALHKAKTESPDLIILDMMLPDVQGSNICAQLKSDPKYQFIPIILLTARDRDYDRDIGMAVKADAYITKPFQHDFLMSKIKELLVAKG